MNLARLLGVEPGEGRLVSLTLLQSFLLGVPKMMTPTVASAVFLESYGPDNLPYIYLVASVVVPIIGFVQMRIARRLAFGNLQSGTLLLLVGAAVGFTALLNLESGGWPAAGLFVWFNVEFSLGGIAFWGVANRTFSLRQGKRLFGIVSSGEILAAIIGGLITPFLVDLIGTRNLMLIVAGSYLLMFVNLRGIIKGFPGSFAESKQESEQPDRSQGGFGVLLKNRYIVLIFATFSLMAYFTFYLVDTAFLFEAKGKYPSEDDLASFVGLFWAVFGASSLVFRTTLSGRWLSWFGMGGSLLTIPIALMTIAGVAAATGLLPAWAALLFWVVMGLKLVERILSGAVGFPSYITLYQPLASQRKAQAQSATETIIGPIAGGMAGLLLLFMTKVLSVSTLGLAVTMIPVFAIWCVVAVLTNRQYRGEIETALTRQGFQGTALNLKDPYCLGVIDRGLNSKINAEVLYCLRLAVEAEHPQIKERLIQLAAHGDGELRRAAYQQLEDIADHSLHEFLQRRLRDEKSQDNRESLLRALASAGEDDAFDELMLHIDDELPSTRRGAMVGLIKYCGIEGAVQAGGRLLRLLQSTEHQDQIFAATTLGDIGVSTFYRGLLPLLQSDSVDVQKAALAAAARLNNERLWPFVLDSLGFEATRDQAREALVQAGASALPALQAAMAQPGLSIDVRLQVTRVLGAINHPISSKLVFQEIKAQNPMIRREALWSLRALRYQAAPGEREVIEGQLAAEIRHGLHTLAAIKAVDTVAEASLLRAALQQENTNSRERVMLLLALIYPADTMLRAWNNLRESGGQTDMALELLESTLSREHKDLVLELFGAIELSHASVEGPATVATEIIEHAETWPAPWLRAAAIYDAEQAGVANVDALLQSLAEQEHPFLQAAIARVTGHEVSGQLALLDRLQRLRQVSIFERIPDRYLARVALALDELSLQAGEQLFAAGDEGSELFIVTKGEIRVHDGERTIVTMQEGDLLGEFAALDPQPRVSSATANSAVELFGLSRSGLTRLLADHVEIAEGILQVLSLRMREALDGEVKTSKQNVGVGDEAAWLTSRGHRKLTALEKVIVLKTASVFSEVPDEVVAEIADKTKEVFIDKGENLFRAGDVGTTMYIIVDGEVRVHDDARTLDVLGERTVFGELAALSSEPRSASITAEKPTLLLALDQFSLKEVMRYRSEVTLGIVQVLVQRLRSLAKARKALA